MGNRFLIFPGINYSLPAQIKELSYLTARVWVKFNDADRIQVEYFSNLLKNGARMGDISTAQTQLGVKFTMIAPKVISIWEDDVGQFMVELKSEEWQFG